MSSDRFDPDKIRRLFVDKNLKRIDEGLKAIDTELLAEIMEDQIRVRTQLGYDKNMQKFKELAPSTIKSREYLYKRGKLSGQTYPKRSNQTQTGKMVEGARLIIEKTVNSIRFFGGFKENRSDGKTNKRIYVENHARGRDFFGLAKFEENKVRRIIRIMWKKAFDKK